MFLTKRSGCYNVVFIRKEAIIGKVSKSLAALSSGPLDLASPQHGTMTSVKATSTFLSLKADFHYVKYFQKYG